MILKFFLAWIFLATFSFCQDPYVDDYDDEYEDSTYYEEYSGSGDDYDYNYEYGENSGSGDQYEYETKYEDSALEYIPEITSEALHLEVKAGDTVELPCESRDAAKFVRVWNKDDKLLFTGNHKLHQDDRFLLTGTGESVLTILASTPGDSGRYECRVMVPHKPVSITHTVRVIHMMSIEAVPKDGLVNVPLRSSTRIGCKIVGNLGTDTRIEWNRDNRKFRDGTYSYEGEYIILNNVTLQDAGLYYCSAQGPDGATKTASVQVQVLFPPTISQMEEKSLQGGKGSETEISCIVTGEPRPRVIWYKEGEVVKLTDRIETQIAGTRHVLLIHNMQDTDYGQYMCYATNSMGSVQRSVEISARYVEREKQNQDKNDDSNKNVYPNKDQNAILNALKNELNSYEKTVSELKYKMEKEIEQINNQFMILSKRGNGVESSLERLDDENRNMKITLNGYKTKFEVTERRWQDDRQRIWDNIEELQELSNTTMRNIEEIYDKDILRIQNIQNILKGDLKKLKKEISGTLNNVAIGMYTPEENGKSEVEEKLKVMEGDLKRIGIVNKNSRKTLQQFRSDLNTAFRDIDELKKEKHANAIEIEHLKRYISKLEVEKIEENMAKIEGMNKLISDMEGSIMKASQKMKRIDKNSGENEKVGVLLKEVQNMKNQMYYLQQSLVQLRTEEPVMVVSENEVGPAYNSEISDNLAQIQNEINSCSFKIENMDNLLKNNHWVEKEEFSSRNQVVDTILDKFDKTIATTTNIINECDVKSEESEHEMKALKQKLEKVLKIQEENEKERVKYILLLHGLRKKRKLERPVHVMKLATNFMEKSLGLKDMGVEECYRVEDVSGKRPYPIRIKFSNMKDRNNVLKEGRQLKGSVRISEVFTDKVKNSRIHLAAFARQQSQKTKTKWALQQDKLYFNKKIYVFNETTSIVEAVEDIA